jgi:hypothetical protein
VDRRSKIFPVRWTEAEFGEIGRLAASADMRPGRYVREAALKGTVRHIPAVNLDQWRALAGLANNLNQLVRNVNIGRADAGSKAVVEELRPLLKEIREALIR